VTATVQAASITTNNEQRDGHIKSSDFLDLENHPTLELRSTSFASKGGNEYTLTADLTLRGVTKSVEFDVEFTGAGDHFFPGVTVIGFEAKATIDRRDFGVNFEGTLENGAAVVSNKIEIVLEIEATSQAPEQN
jgi:polyisoprenoid-binding protein YceI